MWQTVGELEWDLCQISVTTGAERLGSGVECVQRNTTNTRPDVLGSDPSRRERLKHVYEERFYKFFAFIICLIYFCIF